MMRTLSARCVLRCLLVIPLAGCLGDAVQEDRTISFGSGGSTAFQHGADGVFLNIDGETRCILEPSDDVLATSSPQWSPDKRYAMFTTAIGAPPRGSTGDWSDSPGGRRFRKKPVTYTCFRYDTTVGEQAAAEPLFRAACAHTGYVAANLAAKWTPDGTGIVFVDTNRRDKHELRKWNAQRNVSEVVFPYAADWIVFDFVPGTNRLVVCLEGQGRHGIWIETDAGDWWHAAAGYGPLSLRTVTAFRSSMIAMGDSPLERLRGLQPVWTADHQRFAFVIDKKRPGAEKLPNRYSIQVGSLPDRNTEVVTVSAEPISDVCWHPDGERLGFVRYDAGQARLRSIRIADGTEAALSERPIHQFVGWCRSGESLAVVRSDADPAAGHDWAFVLLPSQPGREALSVLDQNGSRELFSATRITFPNWSPDGTSISFWATFTPSRRSLPSLFTGAGLRNGDPAARIDVQSGRLHWMPVNAIEKLQIGHYSLLKGDAAEALRWYDEAAPDLPAASNQNRHMLRPLPLYRSICLTRLNRTEQADEEFRRFETSQLEDDPAAAADEPATQPAAVSARDMERYLFMLEVYLSVDAVDECRAMLQDHRDRVGQAPSARLAQLVSMSQIVLLNRDYDEYARLATEELLPVAFAAIRTPEIVEPAIDEPQLFATQLSLMPMLSPEFLRLIPDASLARAVARLEALRREQKPATHTLAIDMMLVVGYEALGNDAAQARVRQRLDENPQRTKSKPESIRAVIGRLRALAGLLNAVRAMQ